MRSMEEKRPKTGGRRQTLSEDTKKANNNASKRRYHAHHKNISVSKRTHALLVQYQKKFGFKSACDAVHALLKDFAPDLENSDEDSPIDTVEPELTVHGPELPPDMKSRPPLAHEEASRVVLIQRLVAEAGISVRKIPLVIALVSIHLLRRVDTSQLFSSSHTDRLLKRSFAYDLAILKDFFTHVKVVHLKPDCSSRQGEERLSVFATGWHRLQAKPICRQIFAGSLVTKSGVDQLNALYGILCGLGIKDKVGSVCSDCGADVCADGGLFGLLEKKLQKKLDKILGDLHILNRGFVVAATSTWYVDSWIFLTVNIICIIRETYYNLC